MIHTFSFKDNYYIYDVGSGSLHLCDKKTADYLAHGEGQNVDISYLSPEDIDAIEEDIRALEEQGL